MPGRPPASGCFLALQPSLSQKRVTNFASVPGIYAVGDINTYPGKRKLIVCGFHEATLAAFAAAEALSGKPVALQYTTSSTRLHQLLRVGSAGTVNG